MRKYICLFLLLVAMNPLESGAAVIIPATRNSSGGNSSQANIAIADSFLRCSADINDGVCRIHNGCSAPEKLTPREYLQREKPDAIFKGISVDSYRQDIYIYYSEEL